MLIGAGTKRAGITLLEVLVAIFIMGIGMLALLTLFPLGALSMARAVRDDRAATIAANAAALATAMDLRHDANVVTGFGRYAPTNPNAASNVVFVDPHQVLLGARPLGEFPANAGTTSHGIERVTATWATTMGLANQWFTLQDEIEFDTLGGAKGWQNATVNRPGTYSFGYLVRRPRQIDPELIDLTVVVYAMRNNEVFEAEPTFHANNMGAPGGTSLTFTWTPPNKPDIRKGAWVIDTTNDRTNQIVNGYIYRVENVTESAGNTLTLDLDRPLKANVTTIAVLTKAIAVVERGTTWLP